MPRRDGVDSIVVRHLPEEADGHYRASAWRQGGLQQVHVQVVSRRLDIHEDRFGPNQGNCFGRADPRVGHGDHLVTRPDFQGPQSDFQAVGPTGYGDAVLDPHVRGQRPLQLGHFRAQDVLPVVEHGPHACVNLRLISPVLGLQVDELHRFLNPAAPSARPLLIASVSGHGVLSIQS